MGEGRAVTKRGAAEMRELILLLISCGDFDPAHLEEAGRNI